MHGAAMAGEWFLLPEPKFMGHEAVLPIRDARATVLAVARMSADGIEFAGAAGAKAEELAAESAARATEWLRGAEVALVRDRRKVVEYAVVRSDKAPVCATLFSPDFLKRFEDVFGPKMLVVIPNRQAVFVFPGVGTDPGAFAELILEEWRGRAPKVSLEVFELSAAGLRAVGRIEEP